MFCPQGAAVDRVDHPTPRTPAGVVPLLAVHRVAWSGTAQHGADRVLDGGVGVGHLGEVGLGGHLQVGRLEPGHCDRIRLVGQDVGQPEIVQQRLVGHGRQSSCLRPQPTPATPCPWVAESSRTPSPSCGRTPAAQRRAGRQQRRRRTRIPDRSIGVYSLAGSRQRFRPDRGRPK